MPSRVSLSERGHGRCNTGVRAGPSDHGAGDHRTGHGPRQPGGTEAGRTSRGAQSCRRLDFCPVNGPPASGCVREMNSRLLHATPSVGLCSGGPGRLAHGHGSSCQAGRRVLGSVAHLASSRDPSPIRHLRDEAGRWAAWIRTPLAVRTARKGGNTEFLLSLWFGLTKADCHQLCATPCRFPE